jgi:glycosyltransferase involved in cell wall biosynthesis
MNEALLYISYDGMLEPLGQSQVLAYLERLAATRTIHLLSFEKAADWRDVQARERMRGRMRSAGIHWHPRRYHKRPSALATTFDLLVGSASGFWLVHRHGLKIVHARSYVAAAMALTIKRLSRARFVFDMRGFWADERVDGGLWRRDGRMYRIAKRFERKFLLRADSVVSLTHAAVREMERFPYLRGGMPSVTVIPTCADLDRFAPTPAPEGEFVLGYVGSAGTWYLFDEAIATFRRLRALRPRARWLIVNRGEHAHILSRLAAGHVPLDAVELRAADHMQIPALMARMHAAVFFIKPVFSKQASAPTKLAELLGCGVPCLANHGVGDMAELLERERVGVAVNAFTPDALDAGLRQLLELAQTPGIRERCGHAARAHFSLDEGVARYAAIYRSLGARA